MAEVKFYQYKKCSTCNKAQKFLDRQGVKYQDIDITDKPPTEKELKLMLKQYDGQIKKLFNTSGVQYRELNIKDKIGTMSENEAITLLKGNGRLIKRPFVLKGTKGLVGFNEQEWMSL